MESTLTTDLNREVEKKSDDAVSSTTHLDEYDIQHDGNRNYLDNTGCTISECRCSNEHLVVQDAIVLEIIDDEIQQKKENRRKRIIVSVYLVTLCLLYADWFLLAPNLTQVVEEFGVLRKKEMSS